LLRDELADGRRIVAENALFVAFIPFFARYPYEVHVMPRQHLTCLPELDPSQRVAFAEILKAVTTGYDKLFDFSFPYVMIIHQAPTDGEGHGHYHFHVEFYPPPEHS